MTDYYNNGNSKCLKKGDCY